MSVVAVWLCRPAPDIAVFRASHLTKVDIAIEIGVPLDAVGVLEIGQPRPNQRSQQNVSAVIGVVLRDIVRGDFGVGLVFDIDNSATQRRVVGLFE